MYVDFSVINAKGLDPSDKGIGDGSSSTFMVRLALGATSAAVSKYQKIPINCKIREINVDFDDGINFDVLAEVYIVDDNKCLLKDYGKRRNKFLINYIVERNTYILFQADPDSTLDGKKVTMYGEIEKIPDRGRIC